MGSGEEGKRSKAEGRESCPQLRGQLITKRVRNIGEVTGRVRESLRDVGEENMNGLDIVGVQYMLENFLEVFIDN